MIGEWTSFTKRSLNRRRLSNNPIENHFGHLKSNLLQNKTVSCSELMFIIYNRIQATHSLYFEKPDNKNQIERKGLIYLFFMYIRTVSGF